MSIYKNGKLVAGGSQALPLLSFMWADHQLNDISWLRADTFSWQSGAVYTAVYQHLVDEFNEAVVITIEYQRKGDSWAATRDPENDITEGGVEYYAWETSGSSWTLYTTSAEPSVGDTLYFQVSSSLVADSTIDSVSTSITTESETVGGITISFYRAPDGHKITTDESAVLSIYNATGVAWYYVLDTVNQRFKLPRTKFGMTGLRDTVGNFVDAGVPNPNISVGIKMRTNRAGISNDYGTTGDHIVASTGGTIVINSNYSTATIGNSLYGNSDTVQPKATEMYLYFYVGQFTQTALENTAGVTTEVLNDKVDKGHQVIAFQAPTAANNYTWYRKYADGWIEQGGIYDTSTTGANIATITMPVTMSDTDYNVIAVKNTDDSGSTYGWGLRVVKSTKTTSTFDVRPDSSGGFYWEVKGIAA